VRSPAAVVLAIAPAAFAQAPGQTAAPAAPASSVPVMEHAWAIALGLASESLTPQTSDAPAVHFVGIELEGRYRLRPAVEVALSLFTAGSKGDLGTGGLFADFRYRFRAEERWSAYALGGVGIVQAGSKNATDTERRGRGALHIGAGAERRFAHLALFLELTLLGVAKNPGVPDVATPTTAYLLERYGLSGGALVVGSTYYF
jgi:hypothetical protein